MKNLTFNQYLPATPSSLGLHAQKEPTQAWYWVIRATVGFITIFNNTLVAVVIATRRRLRNVKSNWFVLSLSLADLLVGIIITAVQLSDAVQLPTSPELRFVIYDFLMDATILSLCTLSLDRYKAIVSPLHYINYMTQYRAVVLILCSWCIPLFVALLRITMMFTGIKTEKEREKMFIVVQTIFFVVLPCVTLSISYFRILLIVRRHNRDEKKIRAQVDYNYSTDSNLHSTTDDDSRPPNSSSSIEISSARFGRMRTAIEAIEEEVSESTAARIISGILSPKMDKSSLPAIGVVIILYDCFWAFGIYSYVCDSFLDMRVAQDTKHIIWLLILMNSALNPLLYAILKKDIRKEIKAIWPCCKTSENGTVDITIEVSQPVPQKEIMVLSPPPS